MYSILNPIVVIKQFLVNYIFHYNKIFFMSLVQTQSVCRTQWSKLEQRVLAFRAKGLLAKSQPLDPLPFLIDHWKLACRQLLVSLGSGRILILWIQLITTTNSFNSQKFLKYDHLSVYEVLRILYIYYNPEPN